ncbi:hypothetical protein ACHHYP_20394 [Achlya hypogyna]|uniref:Uncharacterized protein n=1 Tax=Achlya hypogyna TaxID=1202772 RepID=A0A1V9ZJN4_ACHHY|nr:hypothetical protein ACHHYP_20394 [Achlya hypogyna]
MPSHSANCPLQMPWTKWLLHDRKHLRDCNKRLKQRLEATASTVHIIKAASPDVVVSSAPTALPVQPTTPPAVVIRLQSLATLYYVH